MKNGIKFLGALFAVVIISFPVHAAQSEAEIMDLNTTSAAEVISNEAAGEIVPLADDIRWRYKTENGKVYKRLFNYTKQVWVGSWILA